HKLTPTDPTSITSMAYGKMFPLRPIQLFNLGMTGVNRSDLSFVNYDQIV
ncbi:MAG: hypothetical protein HLUCCO17_16650, partial [Saliniramus fredricksonii]